MNPVGLTITKAIAGAAYLLYRYWETDRSLPESGSVSKPPLTEWWYCWRHASDSRLVAAGVVYRAFASVMDWLFGIELPASFSEFGGNILIA